MHAIRWSVTMWLLGVGCGGGSSPDIPRIAPPVKAALPTGLGGTRSALLELPLLDASDIKQRFFTEGPTSVFRILDDIDGRIDDVNSQTGECVTQAPVAYTVNAWGHSVNAIAQCHSSVSTPDGSDAFLQFGTDDAGASDIYTDIGAGRVLAHVAPVGTEGKHTVHAWLTIGADAPTCGTTRGSYGVIELSADESTGAFEMVVAGTGFGYCGAQLKSDGTAVYFTGSIDMGTSCNATDTQCGAAGDVTMPATCGSSVTTFALPATGRTAGCDFGASGYPGTGNAVNLDGSATDSVQAFGPTTPTDGTGTL